MIRKYLQITKPKIIFSNLISVCGGFLLASRGSIDYFLFFKTLLSVFLIVASSCVFNNIIDRDIDVKMERTKNRVLATGLMSTNSSFVYACLLGITGFIFLYFELNSLAIWLGIIGFAVYVGIYSLYMKRNSVYGILIGSISGAIPPVIGYCAVTNRFDKCAVILLTIFSLWQIPHSYAIAILRFNDYQLAEIPVLPVVKGVPVTKNHILFYILSFTSASLVLTIEGYTGYKYLVVTAVVNFCWFLLALIGYKLLNHKVWAYKLFIFSIFVITVLSMMMSIDFIIPSV